LGPYGSSPRVFFRSSDVPEVKFVFPLDFISEIDSEVEWLLFFPDIYARDLLITRSPVFNSRLAMNIGMLMVVLSKKPDTENFDFEFVFRTFLLIFSLQFRWVL
jgi:hypothetical protein